AHAAASRTPLQGANGILMSIGECRSITHLHQYQRRSRGEGLDASPTGRKKATKIFVLGRGHPARVKIRDHYAISSVLAKQLYRNGDDAIVTTFGRSMLARWSCLRMSSRSTDRVLP